MSLVLRRGGEQRLAELSDLLVELNFLLKMFDFLTLLLGAICDGSFDSISYGLGIYTGFVGSLVGQSTLSLPTGPNLIALKLDTSILGFLFKRHLWLHLPFYYFRLLVFESYCLRRVAKADFVNVL